MKKLLIISIATIFLFSCKKDIYHNFMEDEKAFLVYNEGDIFKLKNEDTGEILEHLVTEEYVEYRKDTGPTAGGFKKHFMEKGEVKFTNPGSSFQGYIYKDKVDQFSLDFSIVNFGLSGSDGIPDKIEDIMINGITYKNVSVYVDAGIWFSKTHGFVRLENYTTGVIYTRVP